MAKVLFQALNPKLFRAIFIGYLYEIAQKHRVVLLVGDIDEATKNVLQDKNLFPGLEKVIHFESAFYGDLFRKNSKLVQTLKKAVQDFKPDVAVAHSDIWPADMYILRFAKRAGAITVAMQAGFKIAGERKLYLWSSLMNTHLKMPHVLPFRVRFFLAKIKKYLGHFFYYWILPLSIGEKPYLEKTSFVFWDEASGFRADYATVFSKRDYDLCVKDGVTPAKLFVIGHPLEHFSTKMFFEKAYLSGGASEHNKGTENKKVATIMWTDEGVTFRAKDYSVIPKEEMLENSKSIVALLATNLADWKIFIKPHPSMESIENVQKFFNELPDNVSIVNPSDPADIYIAKSSCVVGMPPPSTTLFTASKEDPEKIVLSVNLMDEFLGDTYKNFEGIDYIDSEEKLVCVLREVNQGTYKKNKGEAGKFDFANAADLIKHILA